MGTLIKQECFKLFKKKSTFIIPIIIMLLMVVQAIISKNYDDIFSPQSSIESHLVVFMVYLFINYSSTIISMEFYHGTIKNLLYRKYTRTSIIISKIITLILFHYCILLLVLL